MISILYLTAAAALVSLANTQQPQLVYEQHFQDTPQQQQQQQQLQAPLDFQQTPFQPFPQEYAPQQPVNSNGYVQPMQTGNEQQQHQLPQQQQFAPQQPQQQQPGHYQPHQHNAIGIPIPMSQLHAFQQQQFMSRLGGPAPGGAHQQPQMIPVGMSPHEFADRRGPLDNMFKGKNRFRLKKKPHGRRGPPVKMMEMNRIPKPPKYPLYDMPNIGMATPPPAPLMHPMSHMTSASTSYATFVKSPFNQRRNHQQNRRRPPQPPMRPGKKRPPPPSKQIPRNNRRPPPGKKHHFLGQQNNGYEHPMASNLDPQVSSPPLGRPLSFDEYMERPSHSFTDDPWNFDPFAAQYNSGMNTYAMKYNYDPLGMNVVDGSQSHLDPNKLSYPGDYFSLQDTSSPGKTPKTSQLGGWDKHPETYRTAITNLLPPPIKEADIGYSPKERERERNRDRFRDQYRSESAPAPNSFNVFDSSPADSNRDSTIVKSETMNPMSLMGGSGTSAPIEFSIENSGGGDDHYQNQYNIGQEGGPPPPSWSNYQNHRSRQPYQPSYTHPQSQNSYSDSEHAQSQNSPNVNENYSPNDNPSESYARKEDYIQRDRPMHNLSDSYSPIGEINTGLAPPADDSDRLFRRHGLRTTRQENIPMVEVDGLSLFKDVLRNANASGARKHLYSALLN